MKAKSLVQNLVPRGRKRQAAIVDVDRVVLFCCDPETQGRASQRLHFESEFAPPRPGSYRAAKRIEKSSRCIQVAAAYDSVAKRERLRQRYLIRIAVVACGLV